MCRVIAELVMLFGSQIELVVYGIMVNIKVVPQVWKVVPAPVPVECRLVDPDVDGLHYSSL